MFSRLFIGGWFDDWDSAIEWSEVDGRRAPGFEALRVYKGFGGSRHGRRRIFGRRCGVVPDAWMSIILLHRQANAGTDGPVEQKMRFFSTADDTESADDGGSALAANHRAP